MHKYFDYLFQMERHLPVRIIGYARVSTKGQDLAYQLQKLKRAGCTKIFREKASGASLEGRPQLERLMRSLEKDDLLLATTTDRIARDPLDLLNTLHRVQQAGGALKLLDEPFIDTTSEMSDLIIYLIGWAARWHRRRILENTANGRELARQRGVKFGRKSLLSTKQKEDVRHLRQKGVSISQIANQYKVSVSTISRIR